jgi:UDP-3-O-[3-hydroxymyristoyl] N-acetylglucosamine deacetylase
MKDFDKHVFRGEDNLLYYFRGLMSYQKTITNPISCSGIGLHSGKKVRLSLKPAATGTGIVFKRVDLPDQPSIPARIGNLVNVNYATSLCLGDVQIQTVEHLMAAFAGLGIDNIIVELDAAEVPIMDGSAAPFIYLLHEAGIALQDQPREYLRIKKSIRVEDKDKSIMISPADKFRITYYLDFNHHLLRHQQASLVCSEELFTKKIARARTFGFLDEVMELKKNGLVKGGSLDNAVVIGRYNILNGGLRFSDEFVYHKILDSIGDLYLLGYPLLGHLIAHKAGHSLHSQLTSQILEQPDKWELVNGVDYFQERKTVAPYHLRLANAPIWRRAFI